STLVRAVRPSERLFSRIHFTGGRGGLLIEALPPQHRLPSTRPCRLELPEQIGMLAVRVVDVRLHTVASALGLCESAASRGEMRLDVAHVLLVASELCAQQLQS